MTSEPFSIKGVIERKNSVLFETSDGVVFYEKLTNSFYSGSLEHLRSLQEKVESIDYKPTFESESLRSQKGKKLEGLVINVTESCNLGCSYCIYSGDYKNERRNGAKNMDPETARKAIDFFMQNPEDPALISFYGGEPLNNFGLIKELFSYVKSKYPLRETKFSMTTNFYNAEEHLLDIVKQKMQILVSLDGPRVIHDQNRVTPDGRPTWDKIMHNLSELERISPGYIKDNVGFSATCASPANLIPIVEFFRSEDQFNVFRIGGVERKGSIQEDIPLDNRNSVLLEQFLSYVIDEKRIPQTLNLLFDQGLRNLAKRSRSHLPDRLMLSGSCYPGNRKLFVDTDGTYYMCEKFGGRMPIGDVRRGIDNTKVDFAIAKFLDIRNNLCSNNCWVQRLCMPCIQNAKDVDGDISIEGLSQVCIKQKFDLLTSMGLYTHIARRKSEFLGAYAQIKSEEVKKNGI